MDEERLIQEVTTRTSGGKSMSAAELLAVLLKDGIQVTLGQACCSE